MEKLGRRLLLVASLALLAVAALHTIGHFAPEPREGPMALLAADMRAQRVPVGFGMQPSVWDILQGLSLTMTVGLVALAGTQLVALFTRGTPPALLWRLTLVGFLAVAALVGLFGAYRVGPPLVTLAVVGALHLAALVAFTMRKETPAPPPA